MKHLVCQQASSWKVVIADDGAPALILWCPTCEMGLSWEACDEPLDPRDVPSDLLGQLISVTAKDDGSVH